MSPELESSLLRQLPKLRAFVERRARGVLAGKESASDLAQSVCRELLEQAESERFHFRTEAELARWLQNAALFKIQNRARYWRAGPRDVRREVSDLGAGNSSGAVRGVSALPGAFVTPSGEVAAREEAERLQRRLELLPGNYASVIRLARVEGLTHAEIARRLDISEQASRMLLSRALARLAVLTAWKETQEG